MFIEAEEKMQKHRVSTLLVTSSLDYQAVASICLLARMKNMQVVAEYVETPEIRQAVVSLGIDYMQGYDSGKPAPLEALGEDE